MKTFVKYIICTTLCLITLSAQAKDFGPEQKRFGLGIIAGEPTGITAKGYLTPKVAVSGIASWSLVNESFTLISDVSYQFFDLADTSTVSVPFYVGAGALLGFDQGGKNDGKTLFGVRVPVGVSVQWDNHPFEVFLEVAPGIEMVPDTEFEMTGGVGARFYF